MTVLPCKDAKKRKALFGSGSAMLLPALLAGCAYGLPRVSSTAFSGIPHVVVDHYVVTGMSAEAIRASMNARRPRNPENGQPVDAISRWTIGWNIPSSGGSCNLDRAVVTFQARVLMPRLANADAVPPAVLERWKAFLASLERHEDWHVRYAYDQLPTVEAAIRSSSCARAAEAASAAVARIAKVERDFDVVARSSHSDILPFP
jgi:predicted secreted Zn-dependent protease